MTVRELIEYLKTLPEDFPIVYRCCSDYAVLNANEIGVQRSTDKLEHGCVIAHHNMPGEFRNYYGPHEYEDGLLPTPADIVIFPGN